MAWLAIDLGDARVGLALSDPEHTFAHPAGIIEVDGDSFQAIDSVVRVVQQQAVDRVFIGLPLQLDGSEGRSASKARRWARNFTRRCEDALASTGNDQYHAHPPEVTLVDERLTTVSAHRQLADAEVRSRNHRQMVDQQSAVLILQSALDRNAQTQ